MSKRGYISRYLLILKKLKNTPYSNYEVLRQYVESKIEVLRLMDETLEVGFSKRTFQRDMVEIRKTIGVHIEYSRSNKGYFITHSNMENLNFQRMLETFDVFNSLRLAHSLSEYIHLEKQRPQGTDNLYDIVYAIKNKQQVQFLYQKFWEHKITTRTAAPYALKEFKNRWYVLAKDEKDEKIKSFALDRISDLEITTSHYSPPTSFNVEESYRYCFGIISPADEAPQEIILSFNPIQGKYIKTLPLHETQQVITDNEKEVLIKLYLHITHDLLMELLSFGCNMKVIHPPSLATELMEAHQAAYEQYL
jgi:predicted DNA-binding transcriptional regulator YafY